MVSFLEIAAEWKRKHKWWFRTIFALVSFAVLCGFGLMYLAYLMPLPPVFDTEEYPTTKILDRNGKLLYEVLQPDFGKRTIVPLREIPQSFINATLAAEDINFYSHPGVDVFAIARAVVFNVREQRIVSGASTITQQLVRNIIGKTEVRDLGDKVLEAAYAVRITNMYSKDEILELYLNRVYYGNMSYGAQSAALDYFGKNLNDLDLAQSSLIAGLPQSPSRYNPFEAFDSAKQRQKYVLEQMAKNGYITREEADAAFAEPLTLRPARHSILAPHFVHFVLNELENKYGEEALRKGGLTVRTTLDLDLQLKAERIIERQIARLERNNVQSGALVAMDVKNGQVLAWVGSADYFDEEIHGAVDVVTSLRQPGSSIKPLTYLLAFEKGYTPATVIFDIPTQFNTDSGPYSPKNYDLKFHGPVRARTALASSFNIPAVKTLEYVGIDSFIVFLRKLGIDTLNMPASHYGLALTLGGGEVRLIDMAGAFNVIANYGTRFDYSTVLEVKDGNGNLIEEWRRPREEFVLGARGREHAYQVIDILKDADARLPGFGESTVLELPFEAAVKTGTTRNFKDNWTIGFSPELLTAVWVGNADASAMENISGITGAAPIWSDFMKEAGGAGGSFEVPSGIVETEICEVSGKLPTDLCEKRVFEIFARGDEPKELDDYYRLFSLNKSTGLIVPEACVTRHDPQLIEEKVLVAYPAGLQKWAAGNGLALPQFEPCALSNEQPNAYTNGYPGEQADGDSSLTNAEYSDAAGNDLADSNAGRADDAPSFTNDGGNDSPFTNAADDDSSLSNAGRADDVPSSTTAARAAIVIDSPSPNDEYLLQSGLPLEAQKIPLRVTVPYDTIKVTWFVDGAAAGVVADKPFTLLWAPSLGGHRVKAAAALSTGETIETPEITFYIR